jgi:hypothetical protein
MAANIRRLVHHLTYLASDRCRFSVHSSWGDYGRRDSFWVGLMGAAMISHGSSLRVSPVRLRLPLPSLFRNPHPLERCSRTHSSSCFQGDATPLPRALRRHTVWFLEELLGFKRVYQGTRVELAFGTALGKECGFVPRPWKFSDASLPHHLVQNRRVTH